MSPARPALFVEGRAAGLVPVTVAYERLGAGESLVLLHGVGHHRQAWDAVVPSLTGHETIALDLTGFGESPDLDPVVPRDLETTVAGMGAVFDALGVERPHVAGHSLGGLIALRLAQAGLACNVTALAPAGFWSNAERRYAYAVLTMARRSARLLPEKPVAWPAVKISKRAAPPGGLNGPPTPWLPAMAAADLRAPRDAAPFKAILRAGRAPGLFSGDIPGVPVTIAWGTRDRLLPPRQAERAKAILPGARLVPLHGCGHVPTADAPEDLVAPVLREATSAETRAAGFQTPAGSNPAAHASPTGV